jgi:pyruvate/2-oxoglutarate dehydrogenase complex dihydrolipoamide dehydrogenase (E3) component
MEGHIIVIGGGPIGLEAVRAAAPHARVTLISAQPLRGWEYMLASRIWLQAAMRGERDPAVVRSQLEQAAQSWAAHYEADLQSLNLTLLQGSACLDGGCNVLVESSDPVAGTTDVQRLHADAVVIAGPNGDAPWPFAPDGQRVLNPLMLADLEQLPASALVIGDGPVGFEFAHSLSRLGVATTWLVVDEEPHSRIVPEVDQYLTRKFIEQGGTVVAGAPVERIDRDATGATAVLAGGQTHRAEIALVAIEPRSGTVPCGLAEHQIDTDVFGQTRVSGVYLVGDTARAHGVSVAMAEARSAALHALGRSSAPADRRDVVVTFMDDPQVARVGRLAIDGVAGSLTVPFDMSLLAHAYGSSEGFFTIAWDAQGRVAGGLAVGRNAADVVSSVAVAMRAGMRVDDLAEIFGPYPAFSELVAAAARRI